MTDTPIRTAVEALEAAARICEEPIQCGCSDVACSYRHDEARACLDASAEAIRALASRIAVTDDGALVEIVRRAVHDRGSYIKNHDAFAVLAALRNAGALRHD